MNTTEEVLSLKKKTEQILYQKYMFFFSSQLLKIRILISDTSHVMFSMILTFWFLVSFRDKIKLFCTSITINWTTKQRLTLWTSLMFPALDLEEDRKGAQASQMTKTPSCTCFQP